MDKYIICISRQVPIDDVEKIRNLFAQQWDFSTNDDLHFMMCKCTNTFEVKVTSRDEFTDYIEILKSCPDFCVEWWDRMSD